MAVVLGRKREFEGLGGVPPPDDYGGPGGPGKKPRFDFQESEGTGEESLPATLRILIRNSDAGGIIGKVKEIWYLDIFY